MSHRAAIYNVRVRERMKPDSYRKLGDIDEQGTYLGDVLKDLFGTNFVSTIGDKEVIGLSTALADPDLQVVFHHGESGIAADIMDSNGQLQLRQLPEHVQLVRCGSLFRLERNQAIGWWALHIPHNRGTKGLIATELYDRFTQRFDDLILEIDPVVSGAAFEEALEKGQLDGVKLVKYGKPSDIAEASKWVQKDDRARIEVRVTPERGKKLRTALAKKVLKKDAAASKQIYEFRGLTFDSVRLQMTLEGGSQRTYNVEQPESGHPITLDFEPELSNEGEPKDASVFAELGKAMAEMA